MVHQENGHRRRDGSQRDGQNQAHLDSGCLGHVVTGVCLQPVQLHRDAKPTHRDVRCQHRPSYGCRWPHGHAAGAVCNDRSAVSLHVRQGPAACHLVQEQATKGVKEPAGAGDQWTRN